MASFHSISKAICRLIQINGGHYLFLFLDVLGLHEVVPLDKSLGFLIMQIVLGLVPVVVRVGNDRVGCEVLCNVVLSLNVRVALRHLASVLL